MLASLADMADLEDDGQGEKHRREAERLLLEALEIRKKTRGKESEAQSFLDRAQKLEAEGPQAGSASAW